MSDDLLREAASALREAEADERAARFTRARILSNLHGRKRRLRTNVVLWFPIAAILVGSAAWAASNGELPRVLDAAARLFSAKGGAASLSTHPAKLEGHSIGTPQHVARTPDPAPDPHLAEAAPPDDFAPDRHPPQGVAAGVTAVDPSTSVAASGDRPPRRLSPRLAQQENAKAAAAAANPESEQPGEPADDSAPLSAADDLYRTAHRVHFVDHDPERALAAWNEYLRAAPTGRFAFEARYNRALCLVRLGRNAEAREALLPFARGDYGGYREHEASALTGALPP